MSVTGFRNTDPRIRYSGSWNDTISTSHGYSYTSTATSVAGDTATLNFTGTAINVWGTIPLNDSTSVDPVSNYTIDSGIPIQYMTRRQADYRFQQLFFQASGLTASSHILVITNIANNGWLGLDYFEVWGAADQSMPSSSTASAAMVTVTTQVSGKHTHPVVGAPIGGAMAGFAMACLVFYLLISRRRREQKALQLPTTQSTAHSYSEIASTQQQQGPSTITPFVVGGPALSSLPPFPEIPPAQQQQHLSNITPFVVGEPSNQPLARPSQSTTKQERNADENGSGPALEGIVAPFYTKNPVSAGAIGVFAGGRPAPFHPEPSPGTQQQRPSNITPFIIVEPSQGPSEPNAGGRAKQRHNANQNGGSPELEGVVVPSHTNPAVSGGEIRVSAGERRVCPGERRVSDGERQQVADLPPAYTVLPEVGE